ncbi:patronin isoform X4 [Frankliniella occidentalis]|uniref:Patronin isoform X4 n=1 Tax=Frankliniella occidentalis TaxID=133901 RepID=A0A6J1TNN1_FRAOC|nr:patronin isoform X4 [Frankliniella occidentalis]
MTADWAPWALLGAAVGVAASILLTRRWGPRDATDAPAAQAKQRASVKWLLSKAYNNRVPENFREPFYRDHEDQEHLKPQIVHALASAEMYCLALSSIYGDPNYHNLNHSGIIQVLLRKGISIPEPVDCQVTETVLIQTNPMKISAHMSMMEAMMILYAKEVATCDRVQAAIQRFSHHARASPDLAQTESEFALLSWVREALAALRQKVKQEREQQGNGDNQPRTPEFPEIKELKDLSDGVGLAALVSFYCPEEVPWKDVVVSNFPTVSDSVKNLMLVHDFCRRCLPHTVFHLMPEDISYLHINSSMKQNLVVFLADLFNVLEIHPVKCVRFPGSERAQQNLKEAYPRNSQGVAHKRCLPQSVSVIPDLRSNLSDISTPGFSGSGSGSKSTIHTGTSSLKRSQNKGSGDALDDRSDEAFVVHRGRGIPTLSSVAGDEPTAPVRARHRDRSSESEVDIGVGASLPAGRPSNWEDQRRSSYAGRRSRRNSVAEDSQLTLENFGGSHENLHLLGRNPDKEPAVHVGRSLSSNGTLNGPSRSGSEKSDPEKPYKQGDHVDGDMTELRLQSTNFAELSRHNNKSKAEESTLGIHIGYTTEESSGRSNGHSAPPEKKTTTFAALPQTNITTTWKKQSSNHTSSEPSPNSDHIAEDISSGGSGGSPAMASQLLNVRLKLEEKRRQIESDKRKMELELSKQRQRVGKAAFLQAVTKGKNQLVKSPGSDSSKDSSDSSSKASKQDNDDVLSQGADIDNMDVEHYQESIAQMNTSLHEIQADLQRLATQQNQIQQQTPQPANITQHGQPYSHQQPQYHTEQPSYHQNLPPPIQLRTHPTYQQQQPQPMHSLINQHQMVHGYSNSPPLQQTAFSQHQMNQHPQAQMHSMMNTSNVQSGYGSPLHQQHQQLQSLVQQNSQFYLHDPHQQQPMQQTQYQQSQQPQHHMPPQQHQMQPQQHQMQPQQHQMQAQQHQMQAQQHQMQAQQHQMQAQQSMQPQQTMQIVPQPQQGQRRTWGQTTTQPHPQDLRTWGDVSGKPQTGFLLHQTSTGSEVRYLNGDHQSHHPTPSVGLSSLNVYGSQHNQQPQTITHTSASGFELHGDVAPTPPPRRTPSSVNASPQHRITPTIHRTPEVKPRQHSLASDDRNAQRNSAVHTALPTPPVDDMEPQSISFIGEPHRQADMPSSDDISSGISKIHITSGSRTYRIPSPTRPNSARHPLPQHNDTKKAFYMFGNQTGDARPDELEIDNRVEMEEQAAPEKGFYISFDEDTTPKRPKPPLRAKRASPKKERAVTQVLDSSALFGERVGRDPTESQARLFDHKDTSSPARNANRNERDEYYHESHGKNPVEEITAHSHIASRLSNEPTRDRHSRRSGSEDSEGAGAGVGLVIGNELSNPDPNAVDEMERKKERIMLLSLQRRQQQEEMKARKEMESQQRRESEKMKEEEKARKKEEERIRRQSILEQHKLKKALEEAEREGKTVDKDLLNSVRSIPKMRNKTVTRPRPKTIHVDSGNVDLAEGLLSPSRGKKGSTSNLADSSLTPSMRRDYYRGSTDSLADRQRSEERQSRMRPGRSYSLVRDSPDDGRGTSPNRSTALGRRGSYKTSRDVPEPQPRGRPKYSTYQSNMRARKSNSLMNLSGSSTDQDSMVYRYTDTDSGLGRATPPRRAPSPGMSSGRHLTSPSGPGSLPPGLTSKRRMFDDGSSDISSATSSMLDYNGPRLYKQPATKSNRGILLNAVEYCVFPGVVNKEAKRRVLEEIGRSEAKHFLILFRDAGLQFRALYSYCPEGEEILKLYGTGPKQVTDRMFDRFFKYNSGGKCFSQVHTKHLTVTIDAFTIHNSLWQGKKVNLPSKKDMALVI